MTQIELYIPPRKGRRHILRIVREMLAFEPESRGTDIGLALDTGRPVTAKAIDLTTPTPGWSLEIYGSNDPRPDDVASWDAIGSSPSVSQSQRIELVAPRPYRYFLLWATTPVESGNGYGVAISDVRLFD